MKKFISQRGSSVRSKDEDAQIKDGKSVPLLDKFDLINEPKTKR
jgi:hypothetical protein